MFRISYHFAQKLFACMKSFENDFLYITIDSLISTYFLILFKKIEISWVHFELTHTFTIRFNIHMNWFKLHRTFRFRSSNLNRFNICLNRFNLCIFKNKESTNFTLYILTYEYNLIPFVPTTEFFHYFSLYSPTFQKHKKQLSS